jgi:hypothetical protein
MFGIAAGPGVVNGVVPGSVGRDEAVVAPGLMVMAIILFMGGSRGKPQPRREHRLPSTGGLSLEAGSGVYGGPAARSDGRLRVLLAYVREGWDAGCDSARDEYLGSPGVED